MSKDRIRRRRGIPVPRSTFVSPRRGHHPSVDEWEKQFGMEWERFLTTKKDISKLERVMSWNDSAGRECFARAERRFWRMDAADPLPSPDMYLDAVDWDGSHTDCQLLREFEEVVRFRKKSRKFDASQVPIEAIVPTGWDNEETRLEPGMILGDKDCDDSAQLGNNDDGHGVMKKKYMNGLAGPAVRNIRKRNTENNGKSYPNSRCAKQVTDVLPGLGDWNSFQRQRWRF